MSGNRDQRNRVPAAPFALKNVSVWSWGHSLGSLLETFSSHILKWKKHKTVNTYRNSLQFRKVFPLQIIDWIQACIAMWPERWKQNGKMADLPDPCAQALSSYILVTSFYNPCRHNNNVVSLFIAVFSIVTQRMWKERCVTILTRLRGRLTTMRLKEANPLSMKREVNSLGTSVCKSKIQLYSKK